MIKKFLNKYSKQLIAFAILFILTVPLSLNADILSNERKEKFQENVDKIAIDVGYPTTDTLEGKISTVIRIALSIIGSIFLLFMFLAGFKWMRAAGNQETIKKAQDQIKSLTIGLIIILSAYALSFWIARIFANILVD